MKIEHLGQAEWFSIELGEPWDDTNAPMAAARLHETLITAREAFEKSEAGRWLAQQRVAHYFWWRPRSEGWSFAVTIVNRKVALEFSSRFID